MTCRKAWIVLAVFLAVAEGRAFARQGRDAETLAGAAPNPRPAAGTVSSDAIAGGPLWFEQRKELFMSTVKVLLAMAMIIMVAFGAVLAQEKAESAGKASKIVAGGEIIRIASFTATVETIDYVSREAVLKLSDGKKMLVAVGPEAYNFSQVNVGDTVNVDLKESVALAVDQAPSEPGASAATTVVRAPQGQKPEGLAVTTRQATATVEEIDHKERTISLVGPDGNTVFMRVPKDVAPNFDKISKGDTVAIRYTQALAVKVEAAKPKGK